MAVLSTATASGRQFYQGQPGTTTATIYTAPALNANVTTPSATAYIKEIVIANTTATAATITIAIGGAANVAANQILTAVSVPANDTKIISGINTMIPAGAVLSALQGTASALTLTVSGVEVQ